VVTYSFLLKNATIVAFFNIVFYLIKGCDILKDDELISELYKIIQPIVDEQGYELYHIEFIEEEKEFYLRVFIYRDEGINIDDCVKVSRPISKALDTSDPIDIPYCLEVSSPGINRILYTQEHLGKVVDKDITINLNTIFEGKTKHNGILTSYDADYIKIKIKGQNMSVPRKFILDIYLS